MRLLTASALVLALLFTNTINAGRFEECLDGVRNGEAGTGRIGATDNEGNILDDGSEMRRVSRTHCGI
ncbi:hypothetical protein NMY22_g14373 [Coprinellus aureogranulatus]|nr:hypothetical protein NMY22_g14373 [Coprinellus aureogranulatus]